MELPGRLPGSLQVEEAPPNLTNTATRFPNTDVAQEFFDRFDADRDGHWNFAESTAAAQALPRDRCRQKVVRVDWCFSLCVELSFLTGDGWSRCEQFRCFRYDISYTSATGLPNVFHVLSRPGTFTSRASSWTGHERRTARRRDLFVAGGAGERGRGGEGLQS